MRPEGAVSAHIVWDWNGTLLHDIDTVLDASNAAFVEIGLPPITLERYREVYCIPIQDFYQRLMGRLPTDREMAVMDKTFHHHYWSRAASCRLAAGAAEMLTARAAAGGTQSLCSLAPHEELVPLVRRFGIERHFLRVDGRLDEAAGGKAEQMVRHLAGLGGVPASRTVVIGDALDDARAASHAGALAVLYTGGSHSRASLEQAGVPVVDTLEEAVRVADELAA